MEAHPCRTITCTLCAQVTAFNEVSYEFSTAMRFESANGPRKNSFRPDSPSRQPSTRDGRLSHPLTTPDIVRSGRVLPTSVKSNLRPSSPDNPPQTVHKCRNRGKAPIRQCRTTDDGGTHDSLLLVPESQISVYTGNMLHINAEILRSRHLRQVLQAALSSSFSAAFRASSTSSSSSLISGLWAKIVVAVGTAPYPFATFVTSSLIRSGIPALNARLKARTVPTSPRGLPEYFPSFRRSSYPRLLPGCPEDH